MTNVVTRDAYNIPKIIYDGSLTATSAIIGDGEDFKRFRDQATRSGIFFIRKADPTQPESIFLASVESPTSVRGVRIYPTDNGMAISFVLIANPTNRPNEMVFTGVQKSFTAAT